MDKSSSYGGPPQSTIGSSARRIQAQLPAEPPACVQNAMMRRDKQPFTYTPGGIDLSQIKSPRMAKRISRNAQSEGVSNQPKVSPLAQNNNTSNSSSSQPAVSPAATLGAAAMGMPFQVFPTGPPAPPPPPPPSVARKPTQGQTNGNSAPAPPPPPPPPVLSVEKKTPVPQSFEPPPMGCRPEIKIPPNPMANLRKAPRPQPKNDFWIEEYRNEKRNDLPNPVQQMPVYSTREADEEESITAAPPSPPKPAPVPKPQQSPQPTTSVSRPQTIELPSPAISQTHYIQLQNPKVTPQPIVQQAPVGTMPTLRSYQQTPVYVQNQEYSPQPATTQKERIIPIQMEQSPIKTPASAPSFAPPPYYSPGPQYNTVQSPLTVGYPGPHSGFTTPTAMYSNPNHFVNQGYNNINYPPASPQHPMYQQHHQHYQQQPPPMQQQQQHQQMMHQQRMQQQTPTQQPGGVRIIPIKVDNDNETTATTVRGPLSQTPAIIQSGDHRYIIHDIPLEAKLRFLKNRLSDPRSHNNPQAWNGNSAPNQSRSFRVLQQITDTMEDAESGSTPKPSNEQQQQQQQHQQSNSNVEGTENQMRRLQLSKDDKALMNRVKNQVDGEVYLHNEEDPRYRGAAIPSKAFRYLQNMTDGGQASNPNSAGSSNRSNQMFVQNRGNASESEDETARQYVPPSEQRVEEPKKYTGSAIPSRSFKMLQAMTQSDAPGPGETDF